MQISIFVFLQILLSTCSQRITKCDFNSMCTCKYEIKLDDVTCVGVPISRIPDLPSEESTYLDILSSDIEILDNESFRTFQVEFLRLISNKILLVEEKAFSVMSRTLKSLDLSFNELDEIPFKAIEPLKNLEWLNLDGNQIATLSGGDWANNRLTISNIFIGDNDLSFLPKQSIYDSINDQSLVQFKILTWINLDFNKLRTIEEDTLPPLLQTLTAKNNLISEFPAKIIDNLQSLRWLHLRGNYIDEFPDYSFRFKTNLDKLDLGENGMKEITKTIFNGSLTIKDFYLDSNLLQYLPPQVFRGLNVVRLYLGNNRLTNIDEKAFIGIGPYLEFIDLDGNRLTHVPKALQLLKRLKYLYISYNNISHVRNDAFASFANIIKALSLAGNQLSSIPWEALRDCTKLSHFNLGYNRIHSINDSDFEGWGHTLNTMILRNNRISDIPANVFRFTPKLKELSLSFNQLNSIQENAFVDIGKSLESLEISFGLYHDDFPEDILKPLSNLIWLALDNNNIRTIGKSALYYFGRLQYLNLDSNHIEELPNELFHENIHKNLKDIRLSYNDINEITTGTFSKLQELQTIILTGNKLKTLHPSSFINLPDLLSIYLSNNEIEKIAPRTFINLPNLVKLELQKNDLKEFSWSVFLNVTTDITPMMLNISWNQINLLSTYTGTKIYIKTLDISHNYIPEVPVNFLQHIQASLRILNMGYNNIERLDRHAFGNLIALEVLNLEHNNVVKIERKAFFNLYNLQVLVLSNNHIDQLQSDQFRNLENLRVIDISHNHIRSLSKDIFQNTRLEKLILSHNGFVVIPNNALEEVGYTLRSLDLSHNQIEHVDGTMFHHVSFLVNINLSNNKISVLPDNVFSRVNNLIKLDISNNPLNANFKELFHFLQKLKYLSIANIGISTVPILPLPNLCFLNVSYNYLDNIYVNSIEHLTKLRTLVLDYNKFTSIPSNVWMYMPLLKNLYISHNAIKTLTKESFTGLTNLQYLDISSLDKLERCDSDSFIRLKTLTSLKAQTWPKIEKYRFRLGHLLTGVPTLQKLNVEILEESLTDQLLGAFNPKLKYIEITGRNLKNIKGEAFEGIDENFELVLKIHDTSIEELKPSVFNKLEKIKDLTLDLSNNKLKALAPSSFYSTNSTSWENIGTRTISGGLTVSGNPWSCDCGLIWVGHWLRRWLRETLQVHTSVIDVAQAKYELIRDAKCLDSTGRGIPIVDLYPEDLSCHASALSRGGCNNIRTESVLVFILFLISFYFS